MCVGMSVASVEWLWGGFSVDNATLNRFFSIHYLLPFVIAGLAIVHIALLHQYGSNNPLGCLATVDKVSFYPYFFFKDLVYNLLEKRFSKYIYLFRKNEFNYFLAFELDPMLSL
mgnify:CR=1 FL=1